MISRTADDWIKQLALQPHPEGGYYRETFRSDEHIPKIGLPERFTTDRAFATSIYFLLTASASSNFHCLQSDELWYFHTGSPVTLHNLSDDHGYTTTSLGPAIDEGHTFFALMRAGTWFGATVDRADGFALVSCVVTPGFDFSDFVLATRAQLIKEFPLYEGIIDKLTKG